VVLDPLAEVGSSARPVLRPVGLETGQGVQRRHRRGLGVGVGQRRDRGRAVLADDPAAVLVERGVLRIAPALLAQPSGVAPGSAPDEPTAGGECSLEPVGGSGTRCRELVGERGVLRRVEQHQEPRRGVGRAEVAQRTVPDRPVEVDQPLRCHGPVLVQDPARLLLGLGILDPTLACRERSQRGLRHLWPLGQDLERGDQGVAAEQCMEAPGVVRGDRRGGRVQPALGGEERVEQWAGHASIVSGTGESQRCDCQADTQITS
jgi:hypothetical protein